MTTKRKILFICQVYEPDPAAVGQYLADVARELVERGEKVLVLTSREGYDDPSQIFPRHEILDGVEVRRLSFSSFGKKRIIVRLAGQLSFLFQAFLVTLFMGSINKIVITTVPPMTSIFGSILSKLKNIPVIFWAMDINPDQLIRMGKTTENSFISKVFNVFNRSILKQADKIITLDEEMSKTLNSKMDVSDKLSVIPLWPLDNYIESIPHSENPFRQKHGLEGKFVIMYSGNHSPVNPLDTVIDAARELEKDNRFVFVFIGGGQGKINVLEAIRSGAKNIISLPYQPLDHLKYSLSAADVHVVSIGNEMVGVVHPCKIYGAMKVGRPIIALGPDDSHLSRLVTGNEIGKNIEHGDTKGFISYLEELAIYGDEKTNDLESPAQTSIEMSMTRRNLCSMVVDNIRCPRNIQEKNNANRS